MKKPVESAASKRAAQRLRDEIVYRRRYDKFVGAALSVADDVQRYAPGRGDDLAQGVAARACNIAEAVMEEIAKRHKKRLR